MNKLYHKSKIIDMQKLNMLLQLAKTDKNLKVGLNPTFKFYFINRQTFSKCSSVLFRGSKPNSLNTLGMVV